MKWVVNGKFLTQANTGVQVYATGIVNALIKSDAFIEVVVPPSKKNSQVFASKTIGLSGGNMWEQYFLPNYFNRQKNALLLNFCNVAPLLANNMAITIHDLAFEENNVKWFNGLFKNWYKYLIPRICKKARLIFTVSEFTKSKIMSLYNIAEGKIKIIPMGIPEMQFDSQNKIDGDYVMLTGANNPRKNASWVIDNINVLQNMGLKLVVLGENANVFNNTKFQNNDSIIYLKHLSPSTYFSLIKNAKALIYPSLYEGFGIPILESLYLGIPVVASDLSVFRESFGELPLYFKLNDITGYKEAIASIDKKVIRNNDIEMLKNKYNFDRSAGVILKSLETIL